MHSQYYQEWLNSAVDSDIIRLNVQPLSETTPYEYLLYGLPDSERRNDGRLRDYWLKKYQHVESGGWWCSGVDVLTLQDSLWGGFKPNCPRIEEKLRGFGKSPKLKTIKYEHPPKVGTEIFALKVSEIIWQGIADKCGIYPYCPLPSASSKSVTNSESQFWAWLIDNPGIALTITEGAKKAGALLTAGYAALALPGIFNGYRQERDEFGNKIGFPSLIPQLEVFATPRREISFGFDRETNPKTVKNVRLAIQRTGKLLQRRGCKVKVVQWLDPLKGVDDLISTKGVQYFDSIYENRVPLEEFNLQQFLEFKPDLKINERFFPDSVNYPPSSQLIALKGYQKTGKTQWLAKRIEPFINQGKRVIVIGHRERLMLELARRFGIDYRVEIKESSFGGIFGYSLCIDSLHPRANPPFRSEDWEGAIVIIDEIEQVLWHLLNSDTCTRNRVSILKCFKQLLQTVVSTGGKIFIADADLSRISIDYIKNLIGFSIETYIIENQYRPNAVALRQCYYFDGNTPASLVTRLVAKIKGGERAFILTDGARHKSTWGTRSLEYHLKRLFPHLKILRIDRESVG
jgi:Domain of unknown function (DUF3854)